MNRKPIVCLLLLVAFGVCLLHAAPMSQGEADYGYPGHFHCSSPGHVFVPSAAGLADLSVLPLAGRPFSNRVNPALDDLVLLLFKPPRFSA